MGSLRGQFRFSSHFVPFSANKAVKSLPTEKYRRRTSFKMKRTVHSPQICPGSGMIKDESTAKSSRLFSRLNNNFIVLD